MSLEVIMTPDALILIWTITPLLSLPGRLQQIPCILRVCHRQPPPPDRFRSLVPASQSSPLRVHQLS